MIQELQPGLTARAELAAVERSSGLPSIFTARPLRMRTMMPQPAGHCRQVLAYQVAAPLSCSSGGTT
jgi:hypothetical protein